MEREQVVKETERLLVETFRHMVEAGFQPDPMMALVRGTTHLGSIVCRTTKGDEVTSVLGVPDRQQALLEMAAMASALGCDALALGADVHMKVARSADDDLETPPSQDPGARDAIMVVTAMKEQAVTRSTIHPYHLDDRGKAVWDEPGSGTGEQGVVAAAIRKAVKTTDVPPLHDTLAAVIGVGHRLMLVEGVLSEDDVAEAQRRLSGPTDGR